MSNVLMVLNQRPIAYFPAYTQITNSTNAGILLSQLMYWLGKRDKIYKTDAEIMSETHLTQNELRGAKSKVKRLPFLLVTREGIPAKTYYKIDWDKYEKTMTLCFADTNNPVSLNSPNWLSDIHKTITYTTTETKKNTTYSKKSTPSERTTDSIKDSDGIPSTEAPPVPLPPPMINGSCYSKERKKKLEISKDADFDTFWAAYPRKAGKKDAKRAWRAMHKRRCVSVDVMVGWIDRAIKAGMWDVTAKQFITLPATWLRGERWKDEIITPVNKSGEPKPVRICTEPIDGYRLIGRIYFVDKPTPDGGHMSQKVSSSELADKINSDQWVNIGRYSEYLKKG